jgi:hypothetical protein
MQADYQSLALIFNLTSSKHRKDLTTYLIDKNICTRTAMTSNNERIISVSLGVKNSVNSAYLLSICIEPRFKFCFSLYNKKLDNM